MERRKVLLTVEEVVAAFGGTTKAAEWAGRGESAISNWIARGFIPPAWHYRMDIEMRNRGFEIDPRVFGETPAPKTARRRAEARAA